MLKSKTKHLTVLSVTRGNKVSNEHDNNEHDNNEHGSKYVITASQADALYRLVTIFEDKDDIVDEFVYVRARQLLEEIDIATAARDDNTPAPATSTASGNAAVTARYVPTVDTSRYGTHKEHWRVWDTQADMPFVGYGKPEYYFLGADCQSECDRLNTESGKRRNTRNRESK